MDLKFPCFAPGVYYLFLKLETTLYKYTLFDGFIDNTRGYFTRRVGARQNASNE